MFGRLGISIELGGAAARFRAGSCIGKATGRLGRHSTGIT